MLDLVAKCEQEHGFDYTPLDIILEKYKGQKGAIIPILQAIQGEYGYLPREALEYAAKKLRLPVSRLYGVATFYAQFHLNPRGKNIIRVCQGTACHVRGGARILETLKEQLQLEVGGTTADLKFTLESVACIGACGLAPAVMINDDTYGRLTPEKIREILQNY
ncbi:MAG TPA: NADH-quinone oxidoreductase subunit NuoE [Firmicutes bacterium]|nr:NADH-quinone oxidoreductase subunit NuoE [Bacillota bacterium]